MTTKRVKKTYTKEFKEEAVSLVLDQGYSVTEAANSLGVTTKVIYNWKQKIEDQKSGKVLSDDERTELIKLRKENKRLLMEREILKKASAFFAKEMK
jgi:transposase